MLYKNENEKINEHRVLSKIMEYFTDGETADKNAKILIDEFGCIKNILNAEASQLQEIDGITENMAVNLVFISKLIKYTEYEKFGKNPQLTDSKARLGFARAIVEVMPYEDFYVLLLDEKDRLIKSEPASKGDENGVTVSKRIITDLVMKYGASGVIVVHTHNTDTSRPSIEDIKATEEVKAMLANLGVKFVDHIIVSHTGCNSFSDMGIL